MAKRGGSKPHGRPQQEGTVIKVTEGDGGGVLQTAVRVTQLGYYVVPVKVGTKAASGRDWQHLRLAAEDIPRSFSRTAHGVGVLLGASAVADIYPVAIDIDVDDDLLIERVRLALPGEPPGKKGAKGVTFFCRRSEGQQTGLQTRRQQRN
jgi:hypothetical protein